VFISIPRDHEDTLPDTVTKESRNNTKRQVLVILTLYSIYALVDPSLLRLGSRLSRFFTIASL
jgi:hypothetical protein